MTYTVEVQRDLENPKVAIRLVDENDANTQLAVSIIDLETATEESIRAEGEKLVTAYEAAHKMTPEKQARLATLTAKADEIDAVFNPKVEVEATPLIDPVMIARP